MWHRPVVSIAVDCHDVIEDWMIPFAARTAADSHCFSMGWTTPQNCPSRRGISTPSNTWYLGPTRVSPQTASRSVQPFLQDTSVWPTHRQTDRQTHRKTTLRASSVAIGRINAMHAMRPKKWANLEVNWQCMVSGQCYEQSRYSRPTLAVSLSHIGSYNNREWKESHVKYADTCITTNSLPSVGRCYCTWNNLPCGMWASLFNAVIVFAVLQSISRKPPNDWLHVKTISLQNGQRYCDER